MTRSVPIVDLRSDTVTRPTAGMRAAMAAAALGDDVFGDDPSVNALQDRLAALLGFEAALFVASGTQSNLCALLSHCQRGDEYIVGQYAHCYRWEAGGGAVFGSLQPQPIAHQPDGTLALSDLHDALKPDDPHYAPSRLLALENTLGGKLIPMDYIVAATDWARGHGLATHLDGARLFNAATAQAAQNAFQGIKRAADPTKPTPSAIKTEANAVDPVDLDAHRVRLKCVDADTVFEQARLIAGRFDSVSICLSKGLGAPVGSVLCGSADLIHKARRVRKMAGGGMRQAGMLAAAGSYALDHHIARLADDHALAWRLYDGLCKINRFASGQAGAQGGAQVDAQKAALEVERDMISQGLGDPADCRLLQIEPPQSNMVFVKLGAVLKPHAAALLEHLKAQGVLTTGLYQLRFVTHLDVSTDGIDRTIAAVSQFVAQRVAPSQQI